MRHFKSFFITAMLFLLIGCKNEATVYHQYRTVSSQGWEREDTLSFALPDSTLAGHCYQLEIGLRHTENYAFRDIWIAVLRPHSSSTAYDTIHLELADTEGKWYGKGNASTFYQFQAPAGTIYLAYTDTLLQLVHLMKTPCLKGITDAGIRLSLTGSIDAQKDK